VAAWWRVKGLGAKDERSRYVGGPTLTWLKMKVRGQFGGVGGPSFATWRS